MEQKRDRIEAVFAGWRAAEHESEKSMHSMTIEIWSDIVCPWCYIGKRRFESALERFAHRDQVVVVWRSFELDPHAPHATHQSVIEMLSSKYGVSQTEAIRMEQQLTDLAAAEGLAIGAERLVANTFDAHRLLQLAAAQGRGAALAQRLFAAHFAEQQLLSDHDTLCRLASEAGIEAVEARRVLESDTYADEVRGDERRAATLGSSGVPFYVIDERYGVSGAQAPGVFLDALNRAWAESHPLTLVSTSAAEAQSCEDGSCAVAPARGTAEYLR